MTSDGSAAGDDQRAAHDTDAHGILPEFTLPKRTGVRGRSETVVGLPKDYAGLSYRLDPVGSVPSSCAHSALAGQIRSLVGHLDMVIDPPAEPSQQSAPGSDGIGRSSSAR